MGGAGRGAAFLIRSEQATGSRIRESAIRDPEVRPALQRYLQLVPGWWGVLLVRAGAGGIAIDPIRPAARNPDQDPRALVELLWRDEALELLTHHNAAAGVRSKPRPAVWDRVCEVLDPSEIQAAVRCRLKTRRARATPA